MKITYIQEHPSGGHLIRYLDEGGSVEMPYHLTTDSRGEFAKSIRALVVDSDLKVKSAEDAAKEQENEESKRQEASQKRFDELQKNKVKKREDLADAILSGDRQAIIDALSNGL